MNGEVIKSFLVGIGFSVDETSLAKFNKSILTATLKVAALYATIKASAAGIFYSISKISEGFETLGYSLRLVAPAVNKFLILRNAMIDAYKRAGVDLVKVVKQSILFNYSLAKTKFALEAVYRSVAARFFPVLTKQLDIFRLKIFANMPKIQAQMESFIKFVFKAFEATVQLGSTLWSVLGRVWDFLKKLDDATGGWSTRIGLAIAAWKLLNLEFLATPLGLILTGLLAILALYDDFKVWKEGGESFFNWKNALPAIDLVTTALKGVKDIAVSLFNAFANLTWRNNWVGFLNDLKSIEATFVKISNAFDRMVRGFNIPGLSGLLDWRDKIEQSIFGNPNATTALNTVTQPSAAPLASSSANSSVKMNQESVNNFYGVPGASEAASSLADVQQRQNADLMRYLSGVNALPVTR